MVDRMLPWKPKSWLIHEKEIPDGCCIALMLNKEQREVRYNDDVAKACTIISTFSIFKMMYDGGLNEDPIKEDL